MQVGSATAQVIKPRLRSTLPTHSSSIRTWGNYFEVTFGTELPEEKPEEEKNFSRFPRPESFAELARTLLSRLPGIKSEVECLRDRQFFSVDRLGEYVLSTATTRRQSFWAPAK